MTIRRRTMTRPHGTLLLHAMHMMAEVRIMMTGPSLTLVARLPMAMMTTDICGMGESTTEMISVGPGNAGGRRVLNKSGTQVIQAGMFGERIMAWKTN